MDYQMLIEAVFHNDPILPNTILYDNGKTRVYRIDTPDPIIVRVVKGDTSSYQFQSSLLEEISAQDNLTARILHWETKIIGNRSYGIQVQTYVPGKSLDHYPNREQSKRIVNAVYNLQQRLCAATSKFETSLISNIHNALKSLYSLVNDCPIKTAASKLFRQERYHDLISQPEQFLIYGDLWFKNIHIDQFRNKIDVRFVDIDPILLGPKILQPAILYSSYFLLSALTFIQKKIEFFDLDVLLSYWPEPLTKDDVLLMMLVFPVGVGLLKEYQLSQDSNVHPIIRQLAIRPLEKSIQIINQISVKLNRNNQSTQ